MPNIFGDIADLFSGFLGGSAQQVASGAASLPDAITNWFSSMGGYIATGIESGFVSLLKDVWDVVLGPLEVIVGVVLILFALIFAMKDDLMQVGKGFGLMNI
jgi:hypothetical protein